MSLSTVLDVVLGMVFIYFLLSRLTSMAYETWVGYTNSRGKYLQDTIAKLLEGTAGDALIKDFYAKPAIASMTDPGHLPTDIAPALFTQVIVSGYIRTPSQARPNDASSFDLITPGANSAVLKHLAETSATVADFQAAVNLWYTQAMLRSTRRYSHKIQPIMFVIGLAATILFNADSIRMAESFWSQPTMATAAAMEAQKQSASLAIQATSATPSKTSDNSKQAATIAETLQSDKNLPIGWVHVSSPEPNPPIKGFESTTAVMMTFLGWLVTALAVSFGAPFWYDFLNKITSMRPGSSSQTASGSTT